MDYQQFGLTVHSFVQLTINCSQQYSVYHFSSTAVIILSFFFLSLIPIKKKTLDLSFFSSFSFFLSYYSIFLKHIKKRKYKIPLKKFCCYFCCFCSHCFIVCSSGFYRPIFNSSFAHIFFVVHTVHNYQNRLKLWKSAKLLFNND